jgi:drug/metabolite transporter (DMT)-like permease
MLNAGSVLGWVMLVGLLVDLVAIGVTGAAPPTDGRTLLLLLAAGIGNVVGLLLFFAALRIGKVGILAAIASTEGAMAALLSVVAGERLRAGVIALLTLVLAGVLLSALGPSHPVAGERKVLAAALALGAALGSGGSIYLTGHVSSDLSIAWATLPPRLVGVVAIAIPLALTGRLQRSRRAAPYLVIAGVAEIAGFWSYSAGARQSIAVAAVLASMFASVTVLGAFVLFRERLTRHQLAGVALVAVGVAALAATR